MKATRLAPLAAFALLGACEARIGNDAPPVEENASAAGKAEEGRLTISAEGFNMSIDIPKGLRGDVRADADDALIYPGSSVSGIHVQGGRERGSGERDGEVELRFTSADAADRVAAWYRDPARSGDFTIGSAAREGDAIVLSGTVQPDGEPFTLRLGRAGDGGTEGRLVLSDRR